uniref:60S ribosomal protein L6 n=1 Tax=Hemiselmis tepida TaxID=464990 RepID=A0A7S0V1B8_9CRYP|mmetsp:Transcript_1083/g.2763  ORF Transcript_1083/g.2763 Transcript_1083/m.2763 type:complete len:251 (+) Transcript_1083:29-781(+)
MPATTARKAGKRSVSKAKKVVRKVLSRTKIGKKAPHNESATVGRSASYKRSGKWAVKAKNKGKFPVVKAPAKKEEAKTKAPRFYAAEDVPKPFNRRNVVKPAKLRDSITPGTVLILLAGRFRGKRVVFLKQLPSGLLMVTGPYKVNGVPIRRVNQAFVIATTTKVDVTGVDVAKFDDAYFAKAAVKKSKNADEFFATAKPTEELSPARKADQKAVDSKILAAVKKQEFLKPYLNSRFSLSKGQNPHAMVF